MAFSQSHSHAASASDSQTQPDLSLGGTFDEDRDRDRDGDADMDAGDGKSKDEKGAHAAAATGTAAPAPTAGAGALVVGGGGMDLGTMFAQMFPAADPNMRAIVVSMGQANNMLMLAQNQQTLGVIQRMGAKFQETMEAVGGEVDKVKVQVNKVGRAVASVQGAVDDVKEQVEDTKEQVNQLKQAVGQAELSVGLKVQAVVDKKMSDTDFKAVDDSVALRWLFEFVFHFGYDTRKGIYMVEFVQHGSQIFVALNLKLIIQLMKAMREDVMKRKEFKKPQPTFIALFKAIKFAVQLSHDELHRMLETAAWDTRVVPEPGSKSGKNSEKSMKRNTYENGDWKPYYISAETAKTADCFPTVPLAFFKALMHYIARTYPDQGFKQGDGFPEGKEVPDKVPVKKLKTTGKVLVCTEPDLDNSARLTWGQPMTTAQVTPLRAQAQAFMAAPLVDARWQEVQEKHCVIDDGEDMDQKHSGGGAGSGSSGKEEKKEKEVKVNPVHMVYGFKIDKTTAVEVDPEPVFLTDEDRKARIEELEPGYYRKQAPKEKKARAKKGSAGKKSKGKGGKKKTGGRKKKAEESDDEHEHASENEAEAEAEAEGDEEQTTSAQEDADMSAALHASLESGAAAAAAANGNGAGSPEHPIDVDNGSQSDGEGDDEDDKPLADRAAEQKDDDGDADADGAGEPSKKKRKRGAPKLSNKKRKKSSNKGSNKGSKRGGKKAKTKAGQDAATAGEDS